MCYPSIHFLFHYGSWGKLEPTTEWVRGEKQEAQMYKLSINHKANTEMNRDYPMGNLE